MIRATTTVSLYESVRPLGTDKEVLSEGWSLIARGIPADIQTQTSDEGPSPVGYAPLTRACIFLDLERAADLLPGRLIRDERRGHCWRILGLPELWERGSASDHVLVVAELVPAPAGIG